MLASQYRQSSLLLVSSLVGVAMCLAQPGLRQPAAKRGDPRLSLPLWAATPDATVVRKPAIVPLTDPNAPRLQQVSPISPLRFEPNVGQAGPEVRYVARG